MLRGVPKNVGMEVPYGQFLGGMILLKIEPKDWTQVSGMYISLVITTEFHPCCDKFAPILEEAENTTAKRSIHVKA